MNQILPTCGLPFYQKNKEEQVNLSIILRISAIALGVIAIVIGASTISGTFKLGHLSPAYGWSLVALGMILVVAGISKCIKKQTIVKGSKTATSDLEDKPQYINPKGSIKAPSPMSSNIPTPKTIQKQKIEEDLTAKLDLENKQKEQIDWYERINKEKEKEYEEELAKIEKMEFPETERGKFFKEERIRLLTSRYECDKEYIKHTLERNLSALESSHKRTMQFAQLLSGDK